uniref:Uncharacterized protein n=1 Tax=Tanacetum cinerariifolium TaxID=118510 RepID=A0A699JQ93_TANCI|nr:hypothetical protein [Tanacetum cinerariifolium]
MSAQAGPSNWQSRTPTQSDTPYWQTAFPSHPGTYNPNLQPSIERQHDAAGLLNQVKRENYVTLSHLCKLAIDSRTPIGWLSSEHMNSWMELLIRLRRSDDPWTVVYANTVSVHPEKIRGVEVVGDKIRVDEVPGEILGVDEVPGELISRRTRFSFHKKNSHP